MDNTTPQPVPQVQNSISPQNKENKASICSILGTIIILAIIILGALYFWGKRLEESRAAAVNGQNTSEANVIETLPPIQIHVQASTTTTTKNRK